MVLVCCVYTVCRLLTATTTYALRYRYCCCRFSRCGCSFFFSPLVWLFMCTGSSLSLSFYLSLPRCMPLGVCMIHFFSPLPARIVFRFVRLSYYSLSLCYLADRCIHALSTTVCELVYNEYPKIESRSHMYHTVNWMLYEFSLIEVVKKSTSQLTIRREAFAWISTFIRTKLKFCLQLVSDFRPNETHLSLLRAFFLVRRNARILIESNCIFALLYALYFGRFFLYAFDELFFRLSDDNSSQIWSSNHCIDNVMSL